MKKKTLFALQFQRLLHSSSYFDDCLPSRFKGLLHLSSYFDEDGLGLSRCVAQSVALETCFVVLATT